MVEVPVFVGRDTACLLKIGQIEKVYNDEPGWNPYRYQAEICKDPEHSPEYKSTTVEHFRQHGAQKLVKIALDELEDAEYEDKPTELFQDDDRVKS